MVTAMRTLRPSAWDSDCVTSSETRVSMKPLVNSLGTASKMVPSMSPRGFTMLMNDAANGPKSTDFNDSRASAHASDNDLLTILTLPAKPT